MKGPAEAFVARMHARRLEIGLELEDVSAAIGIYVGTVRKWEAGRSRPQAESAEKWAACLGIRVVGGSLDEVFRRKRPRCGTAAGYRSHRRRREDCAACRAAWRRYNAERQRH